MKYEQNISESTLFWFFEKQSLLVSCHHNFAFDIEMTINPENLNLRTRFSLKTKKAIL